MLSAILGAALGTAIDGADGDDSTADGAITGAIAGTVVGWLMPVALTYATGWLVLHGIGKAKDQIFGEGKYHD